MFNLEDIRNIIFEKYKNYQEDDYIEEYKRFANEYAIKGILEYDYPPDPFPDDIKDWSIYFKKLFKKLSLNFTNTEIMKDYQSIEKTINKIQNKKYLYKLELHSCNLELHRYKYNAEIKFNDEYIICNIRYPKRLIVNYNDVLHSFINPSWYDYNQISILYNVNQNSFYASMSAKKKMTPLTLKTLSFIIDELPTEIVLYLLDVIKPIFENCKSKLFFKDIKDELLNGECYVPVKLEYLFNQEIKSKKMLFDTYYKLPFEVPKSVNKRRFTDTYVKIKFLPKIKDNEKQKIWNWNVENELINYVSKTGTQKEKNTQLYKEYLLENVTGLKKATETSFDMQAILRDMTRMACQTDKYLNLGIKSVNGIIRKHDELVPRYVAITGKGELKFPKNNKFKNLKLPKKYELIKSSKRLKEEGIIQKHCVFSYLDRINQGTCVIYSTLYKDKRYTLEIRAKKQGKKYKYYLAQIQGYRNTTPIPNKLIEEINELLDAI